MPVTYTKMYVSLVLYFAGCGILQMWEENHQDTFAGLRETPDVA